MKNNDLPGIGLDSFKLILDGKSKGGEILTPEKLIVDKTYTNWFWKLLYKLKINNKYLTVKVRYGR